MRSALSREDRVGAVAAVEALHQAGFQQPPILPPRSWCTPWHEGPTIDGGRAPRTIVSMNDFRTAGHAAVDLLADYLGKLPEGPVWQAMDPAVRERLLTSGASMATIVALGTARNRAARLLGVDVREEGLAALPPLVGYVSAETHSCVRKAAELLGLGSRNLRPVATDPAGHLDPAALRVQVKADRAAGLHPFLAVASAGTVNTGAVDDLEAIADVCAEEGLWLHVDGAYGAFGVLDPVIADRYNGLDRADSLALDPHKWLAVPVDCGCVLVRDPVELRGTFSLVPSYLRDENAGGLGWFSEYGIEQTRPFRSLKVWATIAASGREGIARDVAHCTAMARHLGELVAAEPDLELMAVVESSITAFRYAPDGVPDELLEQINGALSLEVQQRGRTFVTGTLLNGREAVRACLINPAVSEQDLAVLVQEVRAAGADLLDRLGGSQPVS